MSAGAFIFATLAMGCERGLPPLDTERRPEARGRIGDLSFAADRAARTVDVVSYFSDPDGDSLSFKAVSSNRDVAAVRSDGSTVTVTPGIRGAATITVTASDPGGLSAVQRFQVTVGNQPPVRQGTIPALSLTVDASGHPVEVAAYFSDPDGDPLTYRAESSDENVATVRTAGSTLTITPVAQGAATITVTATDGGGLSAVQRFPVMVDNRAPRAQGTISVAPLAAEARTVEVAAYFSDPDGDPLTYRAESSDENVATVRTAGSTLTIAPVARGAATITVTATDPGDLSATQEFPVKVRPPAPLELLSLKVTGAAAAMYPGFASGVRHYAVRCRSSTTLRVTARARRPDAMLTLLRRQPAAAQPSAGTLDVQVTVDEDHDVVIEVRDGEEATAYVVHCLPAAFPDIRVLTKTPQATDGLLLVTPEYGGYYDRIVYAAMLDNNGVPRFHRLLTDRNFWALDFKPHGAGRYSVSRRPKLNLDDSDFGNWEIDLLDARLQVTSTVRTAPPLTHTDGHDFLIAPNGDYVLLSYQRATRDFSEFASDLSAEQGTRDSVIQRRTAGAAGAQTFSWNSWDHRHVLQVGNDCRVGVFPDTYAHANSLQILADGDIVTSLRGCAQVLRIDGATGAVKWKLGGTPPPEDSDTRFLEIVGDDAGEFCGQHKATLTGANTVVMFDNGVQCLGPRKQQPPFSRAVEYDVSSGTQAVFLRQFRLPARYGYYPYGGGVSVYGDRWLISWGFDTGDDRSVAAHEAIAVSEVDPATGTAHLHLNISKGGRVGWTYRVYQVPETAIDIPWNLP